MTGRLMVMLVCITYVLWRPVSNGQILYPLLAVLAAVSVLSLRRVPRWLVLAFTLGALAVSVMALVGATHDTPGLEQQLTHWGGSLLIWSAFAASLREADIRPLLTCVTVVLTVLGGTICAYVAASSGHLPGWLVPEALVVGQGAAFESDPFGTAIRFYGLSTLAAGAPMMVVSAIQPAGAPFLPGRKLRILAAVATSVAAVVAGRRAILALAVIALLLALVIKRYLRSDRQPIKIPIAVPIAAPFLFFGLILFWSSTPLARARAALADMAHLLGIGDGSGVARHDASDAVRAEQAGRLIREWGESPVFGSGMGGVLDSGFYRSVDRPWAFELQYHQLLFQGGLVGVLLALAAFVACVSGLRSSGRARPDAAPVLTVTAVGAAALLIANATNPYLQAVGHGWGIALVVAVAAALAPAGRRQESRQDRRPRTRIAARGH